MPTTAHERREAWVEHRYDVGLDRPSPLRVGYINAGAASWPNDPKKVTRILREAAEHVDVLLFSEAFNVDARDVFDDNWTIFHNTSTGAKAGSGVAVRRTRGRIKKRRAVRAVTAVLGGLRAEQMRDRWAAKVVLRIDPLTPHRWTFRAAAMHAPPPRNRLWWLPFMDRVDRIRAHALAADWNEGRAAVVEALGDGRRVLMHEIDGFAIADWIPTSELQTFDVGSDHPLVVVTLWPAR